MLCLFLQLFALLLTLAPRRFSTSLNNFLYSFPSWGNHIGTNHSLISKQLTYCSVVYVSVGRLTKYLNRRIRMLWITSRSVHASLTALFIFLDLYAVWLSVKFSVHSECFDLVLKGNHHLYMHVYVCVCCRCVHTRDRLIMSIFLSHPLYLIHFYFYFFWGKAH